MTNKPPLSAVGTGNPESQGTGASAQGAGELPAMTATGAGGADTAPPAPRVFNLARVADLIDLVEIDDDKLIKAEMAKHVRGLLKAHGLTAYNTILLHDNSDPIAQYHANQIYEAAQGGKNADIFLIVQSGGGSIEPAYLISKTCGRLTNEKFVVAIPRRAKSAATLIVLGADEIHMGLMSELGPIDPQIDGYPALGLISSLEVIAEISCKHPESAELFARYLSRKLDLQNLGYFARVPESAVQYGERLLRRNEKKLPEGWTAQSVSARLVNHYKDHSFVIDIDEAAQLLGKLIHAGTAEYRAANDIYKFLDLASFIFSMKEKDVWYVGAVDTGFGYRTRRK